jgi:hypothetical protein
VLSSIQNLHLSAERLHLSAERLHLSAERLPGQLSFRHAEGIGSASSPEVGL